MGGGIAMNRHATSVQKPDVTKRINEIENR